MSEKFLGVLKGDDPLFFYLNKIKELKLHNFIPVDFFLVQNFSQIKHNVFKYTANFDGTTFVVKFFGEFGKIDPNLAYKRLLWEFNRLKTFQICNDKEIGVINPYCYLPNVDFALIEPYIDGKTLDYYIKAAVNDSQKAGRLHKKLYLLSKLLVCIHKSYEINLYDFNIEKKYSLKILETLQKEGFIDEYTKTYLKERYFREFSSIKSNGVNIHGDVTTTNFLYADKVYAIDMEKSKVASFFVDLGFIVAEIKHHFLMFGSNLESAENFIEHFLHEYARLAKKSYDFIMERLSVFVSIGLLRIARNWYLDKNYRHMLVKNAILVL